MNLRGSVVTLGVVACILAVAVAMDLRQPVCIKNSDRCIRNEECCNGCCHREKCVQYADTCIRGRNPCNSHYCPSDKVCYLHTVICANSPCDPIPACRPKDMDYDYLS